SMIHHTQAAENEQKRALDKEVKLQSEINHLMEMIESRESELNLLKDELAVLNKQIEQDEAIQKQLSDQINLLIEEKEDLCKKELRDQEALKVQYQKLMNERLNEEKKQFEMKLKSERTAIAHPTLNDDQRVKSPIERLQATIRQLENQLSFYHTQLQSCNQSKDELSEEIIRMSQETEKLYKELKQRQGKEKEYEQLNERYQTLLELLGEKTEQVEELKADLGDVKDMYRTQIIELVQKIDSLSKK
ncbi:TATA element modulatory factor 1 TATA binding-domain-containing protein, partial [Pilobolus umbonatus]